MKKKIFSLLIISFFLINTGLAINCSEAKECKSGHTDKKPLNDVLLKPIEGNEEELKQIEQKPIVTSTNGEKGNCAVVIRQYLPHSLGTCMELTCQHAITNLQNRGYSNYLYIDCPTLGKLRNDMIDFIKNNIGGDKKLFFYLFAHGAATGNDGMVQINPFQFLRDDKFAGYISDVSSYYSICTVVIESCEGGSFIDDLSGPNRIIITATDSDSPSYGMSYGLSPFSGKIFSSFGAGNNLAVAWEESDAHICRNRFTLSGQNPQLDDNGNGYSVGNYEEGDKLPMNDGYTSNPENWDGNLADGEKVKSKDTIRYKDLFIGSFLTSLKINFSRLKLLLRGLL